MANRWKEASALAPLVAWVSNADAGPDALAGAEAGGAAAPVSPAVADLDSIEVAP